MIKLDISFPVRASLPVYDFLDDDYCLRFKL